MALVTTPGGETSNSYATLDEANALVATLRQIPYYAELVKRWDATNSETREAVLIRGARNIDALNCVGYRYEANQALEWPRTGHELRPELRGAIPDPVKEAQILEALAMMGSPATVNDEAEADRAAGIASKSLGKRSVSYVADSGVSFRATLSALAKETLERAGLLSITVRAPRG